MLQRNILQRSWILLGLCVMLHSAAQAADPVSVASHTYYFSASDGNDQRTMQEAQNEATPWKSLAKLNSIFASLKPGDTLKLKKGDVFAGAITITQSGAAGEPITLTSYGTGAKPVLSGMHVLSQWSAVGNGIYASTDAASAMK